MSEGRRLPWIAAALFCERVLEEKDDVLTIVRVIHKATVAAMDREGRLKPISEEKGFPIPLTAFIAFRASGEPTGPHSLRLVAHSPSGKTHDAGSYPDAIRFVADDQAFNLVVNMGVTAREAGLYWFDVLLDEELVTRIPLQIQFAQSPTTSRNPEDRSQNQAAKGSSPS